MSVTYLTTPIEEVRNDPPPQGSGLTRDGYTKRSGAPTARMIRLQGEKRWRRLMVWQFSNMGTMFVNIGGKPHVVREDDLPRERTASSHARKKSPAQLEHEVHKALVLGLKQGAKIIANGYPGTVVRVTPYGMVEVRLPGGVAAVSPEDVKLR